MHQPNNPSSSSAGGVPPAELATALSAARERALEQRLAVEKLLAEARSLEERLANEALHARAVAERAVAREHAAAAVAAAQLEREAIAKVEASAANAAELAARRNTLEGELLAARAECELAGAAVADCEQRLSAARARLEQDIAAQNAVEARVAEVVAAQAAAEADAVTVARSLAEHRAARQRAESASNEAEERARALGVPDDAEHPPSLEPVEELRLLEARIALRAEAAKRAAERRASDLARNHVAH
jgi:hypothetical protein